VQFYTYTHFLYTVCPVYYIVFRHPKPYLCTQGPEFLYTASVNRKAISSVSYVGTSTQSLQLCTLFLGIDSTYHTNYLYTVYLCPLSYAQQQISRYSWYYDIIITVVVSDKSYYVVLYQVWIEQRSLPHKQNLKEGVVCMWPHCSLLFPHKREICTESLQGRHRTVLGRTLKRYGQWVSYL
jgi:hypothetical protein